MSRFTTVEAPIVSYCIGGIRCIGLHWGIINLDLAGSLSTVLGLLLLLDHMLKLSVVRHTRLLLIPVLVVLSLREAWMIVIAKLLALKLQLLCFNVTPLAFNNESLVY